MRQEPHCSRHLCKELLEIEGLSDPPLHLS